MPIAPPDIAVAVILGMATVTDLWRRRVPWWLTFGGIALLLVSAGAHGGAGLAVAFGGLAVAGIVSLPAAALGYLGGADALLLMLLGAWRGWRFVLAVLWCPPKR